MKHNKKTLLINLKKRAKSILPKRFNRTINIGKLYLIDKSPNKPKYSNRKKNY